MRRLEDSQTKGQNYFLRALRVITESLSSLLIWTKIALNAGFVTIAVAILGVLLDALVRISNYENGTRLQTGPIFHALLNSLWTKARQRSNKRLNSQKSL